MRIETKGRPVAPVHVPSASGSSTPGPSSPAPRPAKGRLLRTAGSISSRRLTIFLRGESPPYSKITAPRYMHPKHKDINTTRSAAPPAPEPPGRDANLDKKRLHTSPASRDAAMYFQTTASTGATPRPIGLPAYHMAGTVKIQKD